MYCLGMARGSSNWHGRASKLGHTDSLLYLIKKYSGSSSKNNSLLISDFQKWLTASPHEQSVVLSVVKQLEEKNIWQSHTYVVDYFFGIDEPVIAYSYLEKSWEMSKKTDFLAQFKMGVCYFEGVGVERDLIKAIELMWEAIRDKTLDMPLQQEFNKILPRIESSQEEAFKYNILGRCYLFGQGLPVNWQLAIDYTEKANELDDKKTYSYSPGQKFIHAVIHQDEDVVKRYLAGKINKKFFSDILLEVIIKRKTLNKLHKMAELLEEAGALITQETLNSELIKAARLFNVDMMIGLCQAGADLEYQEAGKTAVAYLPLSLQASFQSRLKAEMPDLKVSMEQAYAELSISDASDILNLVRIYDLSKIKNKVFLSDLLCKVISEGASSLALEFIKKLKDDRAVDVFCTVSSEGLLPLHCVVNVQNINQATLNFKLLSELLSVAPFLQLYQKDRQRKSPADYAKKFEPLKRVIQQYEGRADFFDYQYYMAARKTSDKWGLGMRMQAYDEIFGLFLQKKFPECQKAIKKNIEAIDVPLVPSKNVDILKGILQQNLQILYDAYMMYSVGVVFNIKKPSAHVANGLFANSNQHGADASCQHLRGLVM
jgi:TPR repeat protein